MILLAFNMLCTKTIKAAFLCNDHASYNGMLMCTDNPGGSFPACIAESTDCTVNGAACTPSTYMCYTSLGFLAVATGCTSTVSTTATDTFIIPYVNSATYL